MANATLSAAEIQLGRLAIDRGLATRDQVRECAELRSSGHGEHLARLLVTRGIMDEGTARRLYQEAQESSGGGSGFGSTATGSNYAGTHGVNRVNERLDETRGGSRPGWDSGSGSYPAAANYGAGGSNYGAGSAFGPAGSNYGPAGGHYAAGSNYGPAGANYGAGSAFGPAGSNYGPAGANYGAGSNFGPAGSNYGPGGNNAAGSNFGPAGGAFGPAGSAFGPAGSNFGSAGYASGSSNEVAGDDPIALAMSTRKNSDGSSETVFGPYDILGEIARGGMGIVYRARQRSLKRIVALKVMKEGENASEKQIRRFKRETEAAAKLQHPNIVAVHEVGCHQGFHYFTMDLIEGDPLDAIVKRKEKMPVRRVLEVVKECAQAIHYAHGKGIIHRDLKPANVLLDTDGHPKVTDFGLAKQIDHKSMLTRTGAVVGTPFYMPPEQARGDVDIDQRADVYALGVILYELLTLKLPFHGETTMEVYHKILEEEPIPPRKHDSRVDRDVDTIVLKAMDKDVHRRYQSAQELAEDIQRYLNGDPIKARPLGPIGRAIKKAKKNMPVVVVGSVTVLALSGALGLIYWRNQQAIKLEYEINKKHEWETYCTELENQFINARSQITQGVARRKDRDPKNALHDLQDAERILDDLPLLPEEFDTWNTKPELEAYLTEKEPEIAAIYQEVFLEAGRAHADLGTPQAYQEALVTFDRGLAKCAAETSEMALRLRLEKGKVRALQGDYAAALQVFEAILAHDPKHVDARLETGSVHRMAGDYPKALARFGEVIEQDPKALRAYLLRGEAYFELRRFDEALFDFDKVLGLEDDHFEGYLWRGRTHQALGHFGEAQDDLTEAIDITPSLPDGYYYRAELHFVQRKLAQAIKDYEVAISRSTQYYRAYLGLGRAQEWVLEYERARQHYTEIVQSEAREAAPYQAEALTALAALDLVQADPFECTLEVDDRIRQANATVDGALGPPPPFETLEAEAKALREGRLRAAREGFDRALAAEPAQVDALLGRATLHLLDGERDPARGMAEQALTLLAARPHIRFGAGGGDEEDEEDAAGDDPWEDGEWEDPLDVGSVNPLDADRPLADAHVLLGRIAVEAGDWEAARKHFKRAQGADSGSAAAKAGLGHVRLGKEQREEAASAFDEARLLQQTGADDAVYFYQEGVRFQGLAERSKKPEYYKQARQAFARALARNPLHALAALERARLCRDWSGHDVAVALAERAVEADPFLLAGHELLGFLFTQDLPEARDPSTQRPQHLRDHARAEREFDRAIAVTPEDAPEAAADARYGRALSLLAQAGGDDDPRVAKAREDLERAIVAVPTDFRTAEPRRINQAIKYLELAADVNQRLGFADAAATALARVEEVRAAAREAANAELLEGRALRDRLNYSEAIKRFDRAIELNPGFDEAFYDRGTCYLKIGNFVPGILDFSRALELNPRIADQVYNKVYQISYVVDLNRVITELNKIVSDHPNVSYVVFLRGFFYVAKTEFKQVSREDLEAGIADFDRCLEINPTHVTAFLYRGFLWTKMAGKETEQAKRNAHYATAMGDYARALELDPVSGISHYLQALCWSIMSTEEDCTEEMARERRMKAIAELEISFQCEFKGYERIRNEKGFGPISEMEEFKALMSGK